MTNCAVWSEVQQPVIDGEERYNIEYLSLVMAPFGGVDRIGCRPLLIHGRIDIVSWLLMWCQSN